MHSSQLAQDSFKAVEPFINVCDCGLVWDENPIHLITKETWRLNDRRKAGERNLLHENGATFKPYLDILRNIFSPEHVHNHIEEHQTTCYTSGNKGFGLLYLDVDAHHPWQTDEYRAKAVLEELGPP